jgi:hypothetical protein
MCLHHSPRAIAEDRRVRGFPGAAHTCAGHSIGHGETTIEMWLALFVSIPAAKRAASAFKELQHE